MDFYLESKVKLRLKAAGKGELSQAREESESL